MVLPSKKTVPRPPGKMVPPAENIMPREMERLPLEKMGHRRVRNGCRSYWL
jgi:hypothetical protein